MTKRQSRNPKRLRHKKKDKKKNNPYGKFTNRSFRKYNKRSVSEK